MQRVLSDFSSVQFISVLSCRFVHAFTKLVASDNKQLLT